MARESDLKDILRLRGHLVAYPEGPYFDRKGEPCRHPGGLYSVSIGKVFTRMRELTETFSLQAHPSTLSKTWPKVMAALEALLIALDGHGDDIKTILTATGKLPAKTLAQVCRQTDGVLEELVGRPINRVRHHSERLEACYCANPQFAVYGYYVCGPRADGADAPSVGAHGKTGTHWSFAVTLRRLLGQLVQLARVVYPHVRSELEVPRSTWTEQERSDLRAVSSWLCGSYPYCFPNEAHLRVPDVGLDDVLYLRLDTLKKVRGVHSQPGVVWTRTWSGDGVQRTFALG